MTAITVGTSPVLLQGSAASGWTLQNTGPGTLYIDNNASVRANSQNYSIPAGMSVPMTAGVALYGVTDTSCLVQIVSGIASNQAQNVNITGPVNISGDVNLAPGSTVGVDGTVDVSGSVEATITNASLAVSGSVDIASGTVTANLPAGTSVNVNAGTVDIGSPVTVAKTFQTLAFPARAIPGVPAPTVFYNGDGGVTDVTPYSSLIISVEGNTAVVADELIGFQLYWLTQTTQLPNMAEFYFSTRAGGYIILPVEAEGFRLDVGTIAGSTNNWSTGTLSGHNSIGLTAALSSAPITPSYYAAWNEKNTATQQIDRSAAGLSFILNDNTLTTGANTVGWIGAYSGPAYLVMGDLSPGLPNGQVNLSARFFDWSTASAEENAAVASVNLPAAGSLEQSFDVYLPTMPLEVTVYNPNAAAKYDIRFSLSQSPVR